MRLNLRRLTARLLILMALMAGAQPVSAQSPPEIPVNPLIDAATQASDVILETDSLAAEAESASPDALAGCTDIENDETLGPVRDQGRLNWGYAYAAADLISHRLQKQISATDIAITYNSAFHKGDISFTEKFLGYIRLKMSSPIHAGGDEEALTHALEAATARGVCGEDLIRSADLIQNFAAILKLKKAAQDDPRLLETTTKFSEAGRKIFPALSQKDFGDHELTNSEFWLDLSQRACVSRRQSISQLTPREVIAADDDKKQALVARVDALLNQGDIAGIVFDHRFIYNQFVKSVTTLGKHHAAVIVGRRVNPRSHRCEYKIRNSWGSTCDSVRPEICFEGNLWVEAEVLTSKLKSITYLP